MNEEMTLRWCNEILGQFSFLKCLLAFDIFLLSCLLMILCNMVSLPHLIFPLLSYSGYDDVWLLCDGSRTSMGNLGSQTKIIALVKLVSSHSVTLRSENVGNITNFDGWCLTLVAYKKVWKNNLLHVPAYNKTLQNVITSKTSKNLKILQVNIFPGPPLMAFGRNIWWLLLCIIVEIVIRKINSSL